MILKLLFRLLDSVTNLSVVPEEEEIEKDGWEDQLPINGDDNNNTNEKKLELSLPIVIELINSLWYLLLSKTEVICYIVIFMNQVKLPSV